MKKAIHWSLTAAICVLALGGMYVSFALMVGAGFIFGGDIDYDGAQRQAAGSKIIVVSIFSFFGFFGFAALLFLSGRISRRILGLFGVN